jgi:hypothetical protein
MEEEGAAAACPSAPPQRPLFSFGVISDVQYADIDDGKSFHGVKRYYRHALHALRQVCAALTTPPPPRTRLECLRRVCRAVSCVSCVSCGVCARQFKRGTG